MFSKCMFWVMFLVECESLWLFSFSVFSAVSMMLMVWEFSFLDVLQRDYECHSLVRVFVKVYSWYFWSLCSKFVLHVRFGCPGEGFQYCSFWSSSFGFFFCSRLFFRVSEKSIVRFSGSAPIEEQVASHDRASSKIHKNVSW